MTRAERLLAVLECLRCRRSPVSAASLGAELGVSVRSIYRDIASLRAQGATIEGEAGIGFVLRPGYLLPPLMLSSGEVEALVAGARWVAMRGGDELSKAGRRALAKVLAVLPPDLRTEAESSPLLVGPGRASAVDDDAVAICVDTIRRERPMLVDYRDRDEVTTRRTIWPFALAYFDRARIVIAWCELRQGYRHFSTDRMHIVEVGPRRYPRRRVRMLADWRRLNGIAVQ